MLADLPTLSAEELHKYLVRAFRLGNGARYRFAEGLCAMEEGKLYLELSYPTIYAYAEEEFHLGRSQTAEHLRVGKKLARLPDSTQAFLDGRLSFSGLGCITRVATPETEAKWIDFAEKKSYEALRREVQDAAEKRRDHPRPDGSGLPYVKTRVYFDFTPEELDLFRKAIAKVTREMGESLGGEQVEPKAVVLYIAHLILSSDAPGVAGARTEREAALYQVLYHVCPRCHTRELMTKDGPVEVPAEVVERVEGDAERVEIRPEEEAPPAAVAVAAAAAPEQPAEPARDRPNTPRLRKQVRFREGQRCANPFCGRMAVHAHHMELRSEGGRTAVWNEVAACGTCHRLLTLGILKVGGDPRTGLRWERKVHAVDLELRAEREELRSIPVVGVRRGRPSGIPDGGAAGPSGVPDAELAVGALRKLGYSKGEAETRVTTARAALEREGRPIKLEELLRRALRGR